MLFNYRIIHIIAEAVLFIVLYIFLSGRINKNGSVISDAYSKIAELESRITALEQLLTRRGVSVPIVENNSIPTELPVEVNTVSAPPVISISVEEEFSKFKEKPETHIAPENNFTPETHITPENNFTPETTTPYIEEEKE